MHVKALFPTYYPYTQLSLEQSNDTVMAMAVGRRAWRWWRVRNRRFEVVGMWIASAICWLVGFYVNFGPVPTDTENLWSLRSLLMDIAVECVSWLCLSFISLMNWEIVKRCLRVQETLIVMGEMFFCSLAYYYLLGETIFSAIIGFGIFGGFCCIFLLYDSFGITERPRLRYAQFLNMIAFGVNLTLIYTETGPMFIPYQVDISHGFKLHRMDNVAACTSSSNGKYFRLGFFLKDFCLNRGCTVVLLMAKLVYSSFRYPEDCLIIQSRVRSTETRALLPASRPLSIDGGGGNKQPQEEGEEEESTRHANDEDEKKR